MENPSKLRIVFDSKILNKRQRLEGLKHSWILLKPTIRTISGLQLHVQKSFRLGKKCPKGVVLHMDGFALPPFESIRMLHDSDIISVRKKDKTWIDAIKDDDKPLAIREAGENSNGQKRKHDKVLCMHNAHLKSRKKRNHSDEIPSPKTKKLKTNSKKLIIKEEEDGIIKKVVDIQSRKKSSNCSSEDGKALELTCSLRRANSDVGGSTCDHANGSGAKKPSRNARRKKERRMILAKLKARNEQNNLSQDQPLGIINKSLKQQETKQNSQIGKDTVPPVPSGRGWQSQKKSGTDNWDRLANKEKQNYESVNQWNNSNAPSGYQYSNRNQKSSSNWHNHHHTNNSNHDCSNKWNQTHPYDKRSDASNKRDNTEGYNWQKQNWSDKNYKEPCIGTTSNWDEGVNNEKQCIGSTGKWDDAVNNKKQCNGTSTKWDNSNANLEQSYEKETVPSNQKKGSSFIDFESLFPLTRIPQAGDLLVYRMIEMVQWCPTITPFRVGKVTSYNYLTLKIGLVPVPEFPIFTDDTQQKSSLYEDDGTLAIHYPSLIDVRLFKAFDSLEPSSQSLGSPRREMNAQKENIASVDNWELALMNSNGNAKEMIAQPTENGNSNGGSTWDQIKHVVDETRSENNEDTNDGWGEWGTWSNPWRNGRSECNSRRWDPQQAAGGRGMGPTRGSFGGGRGKGNCSKPSFGK